MGFHLVLASLAAVCFVAGGVFMKQADGVRHLSSTLGYVVLFGSGAVIQSMAMRGHGLASTYVIVLGLEAGLAMLLGVLMFGEAMTLLKTVAVALIVGGIALLRAT